MQPANTTRPHFLRWSRYRPDYVGPDVLAAQFANAMCPLLVRGAAGISCSVILLGNVWKLPDAPHATIGGLHLCVGLLGRPLTRHWFSNPDLLDDALSPRSLCLLAPSVGRFRSLCRTCLRYWARSTSGDRFTASQTGPVTIRVGIGPTGS